jgi:hypothetical protein
MKTLNYLRFILLPIQRQLIGYQIPALLLMFTVHTAPAAWAQVVFNSGSTGADGTLVFYSPPPARYEHALAYDGARDRIVLFGGMVNLRFGDTWEWDGTRWLSIQTETSPTPRSSLAMVYDNTRNVVVLFGGNTGSNSYSDETWEYDGTNWTLRTLPLAPSARENHAMVYDSVNQRVVLFGGYDGSYLNDTWVYDGTAWTQLAPANSPSARGSHQMSFDSARGVIILFGGTPQNDQTWEFNGTDWIQRTPNSSPSSRYYHSMVYDPVRQETLLLGNISPSTMDFWSWDGNDWNQKTSVSLPTFVNRTAMVYDSSEQHVVSFGGYSTGGQPSNETWIWDGSTWTAPIQTQPNPLIDMRNRPDGVWHYTNITIPTGVMVHWIPNALNTPVIWLATGDVHIAGGINLNGANGFADVNPGNEAPGGPGGYAGGLGGKRFDVSGSYAATPGQGPGGGYPGTTSGQYGGAGGYATQGARTGSTGADGGPAYGSRILVPLLGGSGGGGTASTDTGDGQNGGGGGGAILIASSGNIDLDGSISANGGRGYLNGGAGSGGAIRLVANRIEGNGTLLAQPNGRIRTEAFYVQIRGQINPINSAAPPIAVNLTNPGTIQITEVAGQVVPAVPSGNTNSPDVIFTQAGNITVRMTTANIPEGTILTVRVNAQGNVIHTESTPVDAAGNAEATLIVPAGIGTIQAFSEYAAVQ